MPLFPMRTALPFFREVTVLFLISRLTPVRHSIKRKSNLVTLFLVHTLSPNWDGFEHQYF